MLRHTASVTQRAKALETLGEVETKKKSFATALGPYLRAGGLRDALLARDPGAPAARSAVAHNRYLRGYVEANLGQLEQARRTFADSEVRAAPPATTIAQCRDAIAHAHGWLEVRDDDLEAIADIVVMAQTLAQALWADGKHADARAALLDALPLAEQLAEKRPGAESARNLASTYWSLAETEEDQPESAREHCQRAIDVLEPFARDNPDDGAR